MAHVPSIAQLVERWTVVGLRKAGIHRSLVRIRLEGVSFSYRDEQNLYSSQFYYFMRIYVHAHQCTYYFYS